MRSALILLLAASFARADVYTWTDDKGVTHLSSAAPKDPAAKRKARTFKSDAHATVLPVGAVPASRAPAGAVPDSSAPTGRTAARVELYSTSWCPVCRAAHAYLASRSVAFDEFDVEKDTQAAARYRTYGGRGSVPLTVIGGTPVSGFSAPLYDRLLAAAR